MGSLKDVLLGVAVGLTGLQPVAAAPAGTAFLYQGRLQQNGAAVTGTVDFIVTLYDSDTGTGTVGAPADFNAISVQNGLFTLTLDFGAVAFDGQARWLEIQARHPVGSGPYETLMPRQPVHAAPYALTSFGLRLPYSTNAGSTSPILAIGNIGEGSAGRFKTTSPTNPEPALEATTNTFAPAVYGEILNSLSTAAAVNGYSNAASGAGVQGFTDAGTGSAVGVRGMTNADAGRGVVGVAFSFTGDTRAVQADNWSSSGTGVFAEMIASTGFTRGVYGWNHSSSGTGVYGYADSPTGATYGVAGKADSPSGYAGFFEGRGHFSGDVSIGFLVPSGGTKLLVSSAAAAPGVYVENYRGSTSFFPPNGPAGVYAVVASDVAEEKRGTSGVAAGSAGTKIGAYGLASGNGTNYGVYGQASGGSSSFGGYFVGDGHFSGRLGIGSTVPAAPLHVLTPGTPPAGLPTAQNGLLLGTQATSGYKWIQSYGGPLALNPVGNGVGINTTDPMGFQLLVNGSAAKPGGGDWSMLSDERMKRNIQPLAGALDKLLALRGHEFEYSQEAIDRQFGLPGKQVGLLAQEVERVFPEWVDEDRQGYKYVTERGTTALMVEALRELRMEKDRELAERERQIREQQRRIERLEARLAGLEQKLSADTVAGRRP